MDFDRNYFGPQQITPGEELRKRVSFNEIKDALFAKRYYLTWKGEGEPELPTYAVTLWRGLYHKLREKGWFWPFQAAARRTVKSWADLRWGGPPGTGRGFRRLIHPNGVCLFGKWKIFDTPTEYSGYFKEKSEGLIIARYSTCCSETRRGHYRSQSLVGKIFPTDKPELPCMPANFFTQEDLGGTKVAYVNDVVLRNAPDVAPLNRGLGVFFLLLTTFVLIRADKRPTIRQLYEIAELEKPEGEKTRAPKFMQLTAAGNSHKIHGEKLDFREEILDYFYEPGADKPNGKELVFKIEVSDDGEETDVLSGRREDKKWTEIGEIVFDNAVASYNGDFVLHFQHPPWRNNRNDPRSLARRPGGQ
jgi:hypothetical protein